MQMASVYHLMKTSTNVSLVAGSGNMATGTSMNGLVRLDDAIHHPHPLMFRKERKVNTVIPTS